VRLLTAQEEADLAKRIGSCPNGMPDPDRVARVLGLGEDERSVIVVTFGYAAGVRDPQRRSAAEWVARADRRSFREVGRRL
jgi:nitroreductase